jgi:hypothetical protein
VEFLDLFFAKNFGDVQGGGLGALLALHSPDSPLSAPLNVTLAPF